MWIYNMLCLSTANTQAELFIIFYSCIDSPSVKCFVNSPTYTCNISGP